MLQGLQNALQASASAVDALAAGSLELEERQAWQAFTQAQFLSFARRFQAAAAAASNAVSAAFQQGAGAQVDALRQLQVLA